MGECKRERETVGGECPLCLDPFELDDQNFFPCPCDYQICRFCWHRIKTDENGLCPACRKKYSDLPAQYKPLTKEQFSTMKADKKNRACERKAKLAESRKHLAAVRVVQKCLVFVVGLSSRIADSETLKKQEYFGKFGKIHKCVVNNNTNYAGSTGHSASAYITFYKSEDALRAVQNTNNTQIDGRTLKASLGTTKYCSQFLKALTCNKSDCMYLHELGDERASFTKEDMQQGKHQEYEQELHDEFFKKELEMAAANQESSVDRYKTVYTLRSEAGSNGSNPVPLKIDPELGSWTNHCNGSGGSTRTTPSPSNAWNDNNASLSSPVDATRAEPTPSQTKTSKSNSASDYDARASHGFSIFSNLENSISYTLGSMEPDKNLFSCVPNKSSSWDSAVFSGETYGDPAKRLVGDVTNEKFDYNRQTSGSSLVEKGIPQFLNILGGRVPEDDLEFDPIEECQKGLEELLMKERLINYNGVNLSESFPPSNMSVSSANTSYAPLSNQLSHSFNGFHSSIQNSMHGSSGGGLDSSSMRPLQSSNSFDRTEWQAGLRALLPNVNIQFQKSSTSNDSGGDSSGVNVNVSTWQTSSVSGNWAAPGITNNVSTEVDDPAIISTRKSTQPPPPQINNNLNSISFWQHSNSDKQQQQMFSSHQAPPLHHLNNSVHPNVTNAFLSAPTKTNSVNDHNLSYTGSQLLNNWKMHQNHQQQQPPNGCIGGTSPLSPAHDGDIAPPPGFKSEIDIDY